MYKYAYVGRWRIIVSYNAPCISRRCYGDIINAKGRTEQDGYCIGRRLCAGCTVFIDLLKFNDSIITAIVLSVAVFVFVLMVLVTFAVGMNMYRRFVVMMAVEAHVDTHRAGKAYHRIQGEYDEKEGCFQLYGCSSFHLR